jgi:release factor H-coupled RctB family protein
MTVNIIASPTTWIEGEAVRQLEAVAKWNGMLKCVGLPDLHPGKGSPIGAAFLSTIIFPTLVGPDIGCGMNLWSTSLSSKKPKIEQIAKKLNGLDDPWNGDLDEWLCKRNQNLITKYDESLGTPGFGNHFIEIQAIDTIFDESYGFSSDVLYVMVHSGSRGFGKSILDEYASFNGAAGVTADSHEGARYLVKHTFAMEWAVANRDLCAHRVLESLDATGTRLLDICHNSVTESIEDGCSCWLHRKGAAPSDKGLIVIPGSRGDLSYVVSPIQSDTALNSLAHGAGRKLSRTEAQGKLSEIYKKKDIHKNKWGGRVVCGNKQLLWEEAAECYKNITSVITDLVDAGLINIVATLHPLVTFKTSEGVEEELENNRKDWQKNRKDARNMKERNR